MQPFNSRSGLSRVALLALVLGILGVVFFVKVLVSGEKQVCGTCQGTGAKACGADKCVRGTVVCTGSCIKKDSPGWEVRGDISGSTPDLLWLRFRNDDGSEGAVSQHHLGQTLDLVNGRWSLGAMCKLCSGSGRMPCPSCLAKLPCPKCHGSKLVRKWF
jgi:hypothetical protein